AKSGNPNHNGAPAWPPFDPAKNQSMELGHEIQPRPINARLQAMQRLMRQTISGGTNASL
ncbi:MAG TPA: hypothetical protein VMU53_06090, partial [Candidatus Sulfotelmatobacter sp.]|nr:hypothetical protein [Candidatus Sulfotelmatobacter sp.]